MKKVSLLILCFSFLVLLVGCGNQVSKEEWEKAFSEESFNNCTLTTTIIGENPNTKLTSTLVYEFKDEIIHCTSSYVMVSETMTTEGKPQDYYYSVENGEFFSYVFDGNKWYKRKDVRHSISDCFDYDSLKSEYDNFTYDSDTKEYKWVKEIDGEVETIVIKMKNNKVVSISDIVKNGNEVIQEFKYGKVKIKLPTVDE